MADLETLLIYATMGHKFCIKCGELWHDDDKCKEEEKDKLFQEFSKKYN